MKYIALTEAQADTVRGETTPNHWLAPALIQEGEHAGTYVLSVNVLDDPAHAAYHAMLSALPQFDYTFPPTPDE